MGEEKNKETPSAMGVVDIKDGATLAAYLGQRETELKAAASAVGIVGTDVGSVKEAQAALDTKVTALIEEMKSIRFMVKGQWHETEPEKDKAYRFGKLIKSILYQDTKAMAELGLRVNREVGDDKWSADGEKDWNMKSDLGTPLRGDATTGSYLIPQEYASEVMRVAADESAMMGLVRTVPMTARTILWPSEGTVVSYSWPTSETTAKTEKNPTFGQITLNAKTAAGWIAITEELTEDSLVPLGQYFRDVFGEAWGTEFDKQCLSANAAPFDGVLYQSSVNESVMSSGKTGFGDVEPDDIKNLIQELTTKNKRRNARLIMHETVLDVLMGWKNANGDYILQRPSEGRPPTIFGYPFTTSDAMPDTSESAVSTPFIVFGNPRYILHGERVGMEFRVFNNTEGTMQYDRIYLRARLRQGFEVAIPAAFARLVTAAA